MRIAVLQFDPDPDPEANAALLTETAARAAEDQVDLLLAPEGSIVSYLTDSAAVRRAAQPLDGPFATAVLAASAQYGLTIAAGTFPELQSADISVSSMGNIYLVSSELPDDFVYAMTKAIIANKPRLANIYQAMGRYDPATAWKTQPVPKPPTSM